MDSSISPQTGNNINVPFHFNGKAAEYFRIWIVNIVLTILTLGIYSAWAKVRTRRYFYSNTTFDSSAFEYLADPLVILRGRLIVAGIVLLYFALTSFMPMLDAGFIILYLLALPWVVIKALQFNNRNTAYRNIRFNFDGGIKDAIVVYVVLPVFVLLTFGLALPYVIKRMKEFVIGNSLFGSTRLSIDLSAWAIFRIYLFVIIIPMIGIIAAIAIPAYHAYTEQARLAHQASAPEQPMTEERAEFERTLKMLEQPDNQQDGQPGNQPGNQQDQGDAIPTQADDPASGPAGTGTTQDEQADPLALAAGIGIQLVVYLLYLFIYAYIKTRTTNLVFNSTTLANNQLACNMRVRDVFMIYLTNALAILFTLGLMIPWAKIRSARYRIEHTSMIVAGNISQFIAEEQDNVRATAGEFADVFDMDIGI